MNDPKTLDRWSRCAAFMAGKCDEIGWNDDADDMRAVSEYLHRHAQIKRDDLARRQENRNARSDAGIEPYAVIMPQQPMPDVIHVYRNRTETQNGVKKQGRYWSNKPLEFTTPYRRCDASIPASVAAGALMHALPNMSDDLWQDLERIANEGHG